MLTNSSQSIWGWLASMNNRDLNVTALWLNSKYRWHKAMAQKSKPEIIKWRVGIGKKKKVFACKFLYGMPMLLGPSREREESIKGIRLNLKWIKWIKCGTLTVLLTMPSNRNKWFVNRVECSGNAQAYLFSMVNSIAFIWTAFEIQSYRNDILQFLWVRLCFTHQRFYLHQHTRCSLIQNIPNAISFHAICQPNEWQNERKKEYHSASFHCVYTLSFV